MKKILVVDGNSIINRAYYGIRMLTTKSGKCTNAIYGMINIIQKQIKSLNPDYCAVAFDLKEPTFRHKMYDGYKQGRRPTPQELLSQFQDAKECLELMGIHTLELAGYEADDIQGTVAAMAHTQSEPTQSYILSGDRDLLQLIDDKTTVLLVGNSDTIPYTPKEFSEKYGILPEQFVDMKALMGDASDNIPGVGGVGEKTAQTLIQNFSTLDGIYENIDDKRISKGVREKLLRDKDNAYLSKTLAKICTEVPLNLPLDALKFCGADKQGLKKKFLELELFSLITKFSLNTNGDTEKSNPKVAVPKEHYNEASAEKIKASVSEKFSLAVADGKLYFYNKMEESLVFCGNFSEVSQIFNNCEIVCYDAKQIIHQLQDGGATIGEDVKFLDLMMYAYVLYPGVTIPAPKNLVASYLSKEVESAPPPLKEFFELERVMREKAEADGLCTVLDELELPLIPILAQIERHGFKIDKDGMTEYCSALETLADGLKNGIYMQAGGEFNLNSPKQLAEVLYVKLGLPSKKKTKSGYSTDAETLEELRAYSPIIDDILEYRQVTKLINTYARALTEVADADARIHTDFKQALTATGRLSSADPNLQNIPIRTKMGREMRRYFIAADDHSLVDADYSQIELRLLAHISQDYNMCEAFKNGTDIHAKTASAVFGVDIDSVNEEMRKRAKAVNFGIVYGISGFSLSKDIGTTPREASKYIKNYLMNYPSIDRYLEDVVNDAAEKGYTATPLGRRRYIPELSSSNGIQRAFGKRVAMNAPIQGAAADIMKLAMVKVHAALKVNLPSAKIVMQVHDELVVEVADCDVEKCKKILKDEMESAVSLSVPLTVDVTSGKNWLEQS